MTFLGTEGAFTGVTETVQYTAVEVAKGVFMVYWHEFGTGANVVHVQDYNNGIVYTNIAAPDGSFTNIKGKFSIK